MKKNMTLLILVTLVAFYLFARIGFAQTVEEEPNWPIGAAGIKTITSTGTFTGNFTSQDNDLWYIYFPSSGNITVTYDNAPDTYNTIYLWSKVGGYYINFGATLETSAQRGGSFTFDLQNDRYYVIEVFTGTATGPWQFTISDGGDLSLPVELASFSAHLTDQGVTLEWATESEVENAGFILDRQIVGADRDPPDEWQTIASYKTHSALKGRGNTSSRTEYAFTDVNVFVGETYRYRLSDVDFNGMININDIIDITVTEEVIPELTVLESAYPNPFNPETKISYKLAEEADVTLRIVDLMGRMVNTIVQDIYQPAGSYVVYWNGMSADNQPSPSGVYLLVLQAGDVLKTQKVMLVR